MENNISNKTKNSEIAIKVDHVSKIFRIPHEKVTSIRGAFTSVLSLKRLKNLLPFEGEGREGLASNKNSSYEEFKALDDVSFEVKKKSFLPARSATAFADGPASAVDGELLDEMEAVNPLC